MHGAERAAAPMVAVVALRERQASAGDRRRPRENTEKRDCELTAASMPENHGGAP